MQLFAFMTDFHRHHVYTRPFGPLTLESCYLCELGQKVPEKASFHVRAGPVNGTERNKAGMRKLKNTTVLQNDGALLSGLQCNALVSKFTLYTQPGELGM